MTVGHADGVHLRFGTGPLWGRVGEAMEGRRGVEHPHPRGRFMFGSRNPVGGAARPFIAQARRRRITTSHR
jgi:hypothetical protein